MLSITVIDNVITGFQNGPSLTADAIEISEAMLSKINSLKVVSASDDSGLSVLWNNGFPELEADTRPVVSVKINGSANNALVSVGQPFTVELTLTGYSGDLIIPVFDRRFLFTFAGGIAIKSITVNESGLFEIKSNRQFKVLSPVKIDVVE